MICCNKCFCDFELKAIIERLGQIGNCQICGGSNVYIYNTDKNTDLVEYFDEFISIYTPTQSLPLEFPKAEMRLLKDELFTNWNIFNKLNATNIYKIITSICSEKYQQIPEHFDYPVGIAEFYSPEYLNEHSLLRTNSWENFVTALKTQNRFHTNLINLEILERFCSYIRKPYKKGTVFYRGRIASSSGLCANEMGAPPHEKASAGRANAQGIRCLYLADSFETTIREVRAGAFDLISVGKFELQEDIIVVDLKSIDKISPFLEDLDCMEHAINKEHLNKINDEMGKAVRKSDSDLDYVPTQYISDFIKSIEHDGQAEYAGLEYNSTMKSDGFNLAIFYADLFKCIDVKTYRITELNYRAEEWRL
ncbi:MAG: RES family NAD+ phosphorylase [Bacillota bacterium]